MAMDTPVAEDAGEPATPGLLRLPSELRLEIYGSLTHPKSRKNPYAHFGSDHYHISKRSFQLPILQVCRQLRYEATPYWYGPYYLKAQFRDVRGYDLEIERSFHEIGTEELLKWLQTVELQVLQCMKGVQMVHLPHTCKTWEEGFSNYETTAIGFEKHMTSATFNYIGACCRAKTEFDEGGKTLVQMFIRKVENRPTLIKQELLVLVEQLRALNDDFEHNAWKEKIHGDYIGDESD